MTNPRVHIVTFDVPWPDNYGGVIDVFHKIRHLHALGYEIHLHSFTYGRPEATILNRYCSAVYYYQRKVSKLLLLQSTPYIVAGRVNDQLVKRVLADNAPVLLEGLHCTAQFAEMGLQRRTIIMRAHNIEHDYYHHLSKTETHPFKKLYLEQEAVKLQKYESSVLNHLPVAAISLADYNYFRQRYGHAIHIPAFHRNDSVNILEGRGEYFFYHGNLGVSENLAAVNWLLQEVLPHLQHKLVIAGQKIPARLIQQYASKGVEFHVSPSSEEMGKLIRNAQVILLPAVQETGIKLKLIESLYNGRHLLVNTAMANEPVLKSMCHLCDDPQQFAETANHLFVETFTDSDIRKREELLLENYSNRTSASNLRKALQASW